MEAMMYVFQLLDALPIDGRVIDLDTVRIASHVPVCFDHSRNKTVGRIVKVWRDSDRLLCSLEFADTPSGRCCAWATFNGDLSHVSPMILHHQQEGLIRHAIIVEVCITCPAGEPRSIRNVLVSKPVDAPQQPSMSEAFQGNNWMYDREAMKNWLEAQPIEADGLAIDDAPYYWEDPELESIA